MKALAVLAAILVGLYLAGSARAETLYAKAKRIVYATFPDATQDAALRVVGCETGYTYKPWAKNKSGALGYFQFIPENHNRVIRWGRMTMTVDYHRMWQPWYATRAALILSRGGTDWGEWTCKP